MSLRHPTLRLTVTLIKVLCLCLLALAGPACAKQAQLRSEAVVEAFGNVPPLSMTFSGAGLGIAEARDIPVTVIAYGNGYEDVAFLSTVGNPTALNPHRGLRQAAEQLGWPVLDLSDPASTSLLSVGRTLAALVCGAGTDGCLPG